MKKISTIIMSLVLTLNICSLVAYADGDINVTINGNILTFDVPPQLIENRTMVPLRAIFEAMGINVDWDNNTKTITATKDTEKVMATIDSKNVYISGETKILDVPPMIIDGRTLVPVRFVAESFGANVDWDASTKTVVIETNVDNNVDLPDIVDTPTTDSKKELGQDILNFVQGFELAEFSKFNSFASENGLGGTKIYFQGVLDEITILETGIQNDMILGFFTDIDGNKWYGKLSTTLLDDGATYEKFINKDLVVCGIYDGYSTKLNKPGFTLYKLMVADTGEIQTGLGVTTEALNIKTYVSSDKNNKADSTDDITKVNSNKYDFTSTTGIESYLYENYKSLDSAIGKWNFTFNVTDFGSYNADFCIHIEYDLGMMTDVQYGSSSYSDSQIEQTKEQLQDFMKRLATDLIDKIPNKKLTGSYHYSYYRYPNLKMNLIINNYYTWANYDRSYGNDDPSVSVFRWLPNLDGRTEY